LTVKLFFNEATEDYLNFMRTPELLFDTVPLVWSPGTARSVAYRFKMLGFWLVRAVGVKP
jgi:hypothetical protein